MCEFHDFNSNALGDIWWTDKFIYFSIIDRGLVGCGLSSSTSWTLNWLMFSSSKFFTRTTVYIYSKIITYIREV